MRVIDKYINVMPRPLVRAIRNIWLSLLDIQDKIRGEKDALTPPRSLHYVGGGDFKAIGQGFVAHFKKIGGLLPDETVLDIGCGTGRMAIPLLQYINSTGGYVGFDISQKAINWCRKNITLKNPGFRFLYADICNKEYNPRGRISADEYVFPCDDESIDFVFATSVFTHMREQEVRHYLSEIWRVIKPSGRAWLNFFIVDETTDELTTSGRSSLNFNVNLGDCYTIDAHTPERAIAYSEPQILNLLKETQLVLSSPVFYGSWSGRPGMLESQDVILVKKE